MESGFKPFILIIISLLMIISVSGCIDIHWASGFLEEEAAPVENKEFTKWKLDYFFEFGPHTDEMPIHINKDTIWMNISIEVYMEQASGVLRNVQITLSEPGDSPGTTKEYMQREYVSTAFDNIYVENPEVGVWKVEISGSGFSIGDISDGYSVEVTTYEPDRWS